MDTTAYLTAQGWRGSGHSLDAGNRGLAKPLLTSRKSDVLGIGKKKHDLADQWWLRAFDSSLRALDTSKKGEVKVRDDAGLQKMRGGLTPLYRCFVQGESLRGTISPEEAEVVVEPEAGSMRKRTGETVEERRARRAKKKRKRERAMARGDDNGQDPGRVLIGESESEDMTPMASVGLSLMDASIEEPYQPDGGSVVRAKKPNRKPISEAPAASAAIPSASMPTSTAKDTSKERRERKEAKKLRKLEHASEVEIASKEERKKKKKKSS
ncbi:MAG: hypothetical protein M1829_006281 [Trizodia sp. TS-e1964]|nr:MAG: hypothetical protein M1829_006281 [Trizodia sp. TS-e1964]